MYPQRRIPLSEAVFASAEVIAPHEAIGRISAAHVGIYPPGIAWLTAGDEITADIAEMIETTPADRLFGANGGIRCVK